jgi:hypothetical protein
MKFVNTSIKKFSLLSLFLFRIFNRAALTGRRREIEDSENAATIIFVASIRDFQLTNEGEFGPDKIEFWRQEITTLKLSSKLVIMPFSSRQNKKIPNDAHFIEPFAFPSRFTKISFWSIVRLVMIRRASLETSNTPLSVYIAKQIWINFLSNSKPRVVIGIGLTDVLLETCKEMGIKTIECQHGVFSEIELKRWWHVPTKSKSSYPDLLLTWHSYYSKITKELGISALTVGYPFNFPEIDQCETFPCEPTTSSREFIVATLSCREVSGIDTWGMIDKNMDCALNLLIKQGYQVCLRIHPIAEKGLIRRIQITRWLNRRYRGAEVVFPSDVNILNSLKSASIHLTVSSSTILEASYLGIPTLSLSSECLAWFPPELTELGIIKSTTTETILIDAICLLKLPTVQFRNPLNIHGFREVILKWTSDSD